MSERGGILLVTIGMRDPLGSGGQPTGPLRAALELRPEVVALFHTAGSMANLDATCDAIRQAAAGQPVELRPLLLEGNPADQEAMLSQVRDHVERLRGAGAFRSGQPVHVCGTSGTPQMRTALVIAVGNRFPQAMFWDALDPAKADGQQLLRPVAPDILRVWAQLGSGFRLLRSGRAAESLVAMEHASGSELLGWSLPQVTTAIELARLLHRLSEYAMDEAAESLAALLGAVEAAPCRPVQRLLDWYGPVLAAAAGRGGPAAAWPAELAAMAVREFESGRRVLGLVRLASAVEVTIAVRLQQSHGIRTTDLGDQRARVESCLGVEAIDTAAGRAYVRSWRDALRLLVVLEGGELGTGAGRGGTRLVQAQRLHRCRSELLHVGTSSARQELDAAFEAGRDFVAWLFERFGWSALGDVPSLPAGIRAAADVLADRAGIAVAS